MLFTTAVFFCAFLPVTLALFFLFGRAERAAAPAALLLASLFFYGFWMPQATLLLVASIAVNYAVGLRIAAERDSRPASASAWMAGGVGFDLALLGYFKYANFFVDNLDALLGRDLAWSRVVLPIGISFFTFTQIAYLVDTRRAKASEYSFVNYGLFVTYFPHLIAGPVLHHSQMMPQFADRSIYRFDAARFAGGLAIFALGLCKKVLLADGIAPYADAVFGPADAGARPDPLEAWIGAAAYSLQLYFDFSGYSDMAIGLSWMFNVRLPFNFDSPYRSTSIIEFWRRWHISLSNFLRDYLYIALGGGRRGAIRRYVNLLTTMLLGGLWHGASWTFVFWGGLHGLYLMLDHGWRAWLGAAAIERLARRRAYTAAAWALTMLAVIVGWVFFRAESFAGAMRLLSAMAGQRAATDAHVLLWNAGLAPRVGALWCAALALIAIWPWNSNRIGVALLSRCRADARVASTIGGAALALASLLVLINTARDSASAFIYFNF
jgi:alginate O-acetyltransferase complex protein AlgI